LDHVIRSTRLRAGKVRRLVLSLSFGQPGERLDLLPCAQDDQV
jgi:hypothetical protein